MSAGRGRDPVTVVVPTRDRWPLLGLTLRSVLAQRDVAVSVVVVDDASVAEGTAAELRDPRVTVLRHDVARGVAAARNRGLAVVRDPWVAFTDDDDVWAPGKLRAQLDAIAATPGARWSCTGALLVDDALRVIGHARPPSSGDVADLLLVKNAVPGGGSTVLAATDLARTVGGFDEALSNSADYELWIRLALAAPVATVDEPLVAYRVHAGSLSRHLDDFFDEIGYVRAKHERELRRRGLIPAASIHVWVADRCQRSGRRLRAAREYVRGAPALGWPRALGRAAEALVAPGAVRRRDRRRGAGVPAAWTASAAAWLPAYAGA